MRMRQTIVGLLCLACLAWVAVGQEVAPAPASAPATAPAMPKPESVLQYIPADAMAYVVVNDIGTTMGRVDGYLTAVGLSELVSPMMPNGVLGAIKSAAMLGEGFNSSGGFAVVLLNTEKFGVDLAAMINSQATSQEATSQPQTQPEQKQKVPFAILVPGTSVQAVFGNYPITPAGKYSQVALRMGPMMATQLGGYVCLSPTAEVLDALTAQAGAGAAAAPSPQRAALIARSDIAIHVNVAACMPILEKFMTKAQTQINAGGAPPTMKALWGTYLDIYKQLLTQITDLDVAYRIAPTGLVWESLVGFKADTPLGRAIAAVQPPTNGNLLNRLSDKSYVLAVGSVESTAAGAQDEAKALNRDMIDKWLAAEPFSKLDDQTKADIKDVLNGCMSQQVESGQIVIGGAPEGSGVFGATLVYRCKDSAAFKDLWLRAAPLAEKVIATFAGQEPLPFKIVVTKGAATVDGLAVDAIEIVQDPNAMTEESKTKLTAVMGEDKIRIYLAAADPQTLVITFGGGQPYLTEALKVAKAADGKILSNPDVAEALAVMPKNLTTLGLLNVGNLFSVIVKANQTLEGPQAVPPFQITTQTPVAFGGGVEGGYAHGVVYIPNQLVKDVVSIVKTFTGRGPQTMPSQTMPSGSPPAEGGF
ncbi:MAG: hypothetical protein ABSH10_10250 [Phycisphaerae bacterium]